MLNSLNSSLLSRGLIRVSGPERKSFLQRLITNDITLLDAQPVLYGLLLNSQGRVLHDFFVVEIDEALFVEVRLAALSFLLNRLSLYQLNAAIEIQDVTSDYAVLWSDSPASGFTYADPRLPELGFRSIVPSSLVNSEQVSEEAYRLKCLKLGIPEEGYGLESGRTIPLEAGLQDLQGISWSKGCYVGQELIARTYHRGEVRKRFFPVTAAVPLQTLPCSIKTESGEAAGEMVYSVQNQGIARLRLAFLSQPLFIENELLTVSHPDWIGLK